MKLAKIVLRLGIEPRSKFLNKYRFVSLYSCYNSIYIRNIYLKTIFLVEEKKMANNVTGMIFSVTGTFI